MTRALLALLAISLGRPLAAQSCGAQAQEVWRVLDSAYVEITQVTDRWAAARERLGQCVGGLSAALTAELISLGDPGLRLLDAAQVAEFIGEVGGDAESAVGLPELLSVDVDRHTGRIYVVTPLRGSSAMTAGVRHGDSLLAVDRTPVGNRTLEQVMAMIRGGRGMLRLTVLRGADTVTVSMPRNYANPGRTVRGGTLPTAIGDVAYASITIFRTGTAGELVALLDTLAAAAARGLILDLRSNPGGAVFEAIELADRLTPAGSDIGAMALARDTIGLEDAHAPAHPLGRIVVLIDRATASAAELLAAALRAAGATLIGEPTAGKAYVHGAVPLPDGSVIVFPQASLLAPGGAGFLDRGLPPDESHPDPYRPLPPDARGTDDAVLARALELFH